MRRIASGSRPWPPIADVPRGTRNFQNLGSLCDYEQNHELTNEDVFLCESRLALRNPDGPWVQLGYRMSDTSTMSTLALVVRGHVDRCRVTLPCICDMKISNASPSQHTSSISARTESLSGVTIVLTSSTNQYNDDALIYGHIGSVHSLRQLTQPVACSYRPCHRMQPHA